MRKFISSWWKAIIGLILGYTIGALVIVSRPVSYDMVLKYLQAFISFPMAIIVVFTTLIAVYKDEFRELFTKMQAFKAAGVEATFIQAQAIAAAQTERIIEEVVVAEKEPERKEIDNLPSGAERDEKIQQLEKEADELRKRLHDAVGQSAGPVSLNEYSIEVLRSVIQPVMNIELANVDFPHRRSYRRLNDVVIKERWARFRPTCLEKIVRHFPMFGQIYSSAVLEAAVDRAFEFYQKGGTSSGDYSYPMSA